jgi:DNA-binding SARP family transcriptional activator/TolB-like protein
MIDFRVLGALEVHTIGPNGPQSVLTQPKRLALLLYLALAEPLGLHSRERLMALLWPEADDASSRHSLRNALHALRQVLGDDAIVTRGEAYVGLDFSAFKCDALDLRARLAAQQLDDALALWTGDLAPGFHVSGAPEFERWLDEQRDELRRALRAAAWKRARELEGVGQPEVDAVRRALRLDPADEPGARRLMRLLAAGGDLGGALRVYQELTDHFARELESEPSAETRVLVSELRSAGDTVRVAARPKIIAPAPQPIEPALDAPPTTFTIKTRHRPRAILVRSAILLAALVASAAYVGSQRWSTNEGADTKPLTLGAIPFQNVARDTALDYRADGISDEILTAMGKVAGIEIVGRNAARHYRDRDVIDERAVEREIGARFLVTGTYRQSGGRLIVSAQLNDSMSRGELWARSFSGALTDLGSLSDDIARAIADTLHGRYRGRVGDAKRGSLNAGTTSTAALDDYLLGQALLQRRGSGVKESVAKFEHAITLDPKFARAHAALAKALTFLPWFNGIPMDEVKDGVMIAARRALELDSTLADAHTAMAMVYPSSGQWENSVTEFKRAIDLEPDNFEAQFSYGRILLLRGNVTEALGQLARARKLEQTSGLVSAWTSYALFLNHQPDSALKEIARAIVLDSTLSATTNLGATMSLGMGRPEVARRLMVLERPVFHMTNAAYVFAKLGDTATANRLVAAMESNNPRPWFTDVARASVMLAVGDSAGALRALEQSARTSGAMWSVFIPLGDPAFDLVRSSPRFAELVHQAGLDVRSFPTVRTGRSR